MHDRIMIVPYNKSFLLCRQYNNLTEITLPEHLKRLTDYERYERQCRQLHQKVQQHYQSKMGNDIKNDDTLARSRRRTVSVITIEVY